MGSDVEQRECSCSVLSFQVTDSSQLCARFAVRLLLLLHIPTSGPDPRLGMGGGGDCMAAPWGSESCPGTQGPANGMEFWAVGGELGSVW